MSKIEIVEVTSRKDWKAFFQFPWRIYQDDVHWVPPLLMEQKKMLNPRKNPFFADGKSIAYIALETGQVAGRILAFVDPHHNQFYHDKTGFIGFFECIDDQATADRLFQAAASWLLEQNVEVMRGPINLSLANESGLLTSGFDSPPYVQMNHTPPYYLSLFENWDFQKTHELQAYLTTVNGIVNFPGLLPRLKRVSERVTRQSQFQIRPINMKRYKEEVLNITRLYNEFMKDNWGFVPASEEEMFFMGESLKMVIDPDLVFFIERDGKAIGCSLGVPDVNQLLPRLNGKLFPFGVFQFLYQRKKIRKLRIMLMGIEPGFRNKGLDVLLYYQTIKRSTEKGYTTAELSWISEDNTVLLSVMEKLGADLYKRYHVFDKEIVSKA